MNLLTKIVLAVIIAALIILIIIAYVLGAINDNDDYGI